MSFSFVDQSSKSKHETGRPNDFLMLEKQEENTRQTPDLFLMKSFGLNEKKFGDLTFDKRSESGIITNDEKSDTLDNRITKEFEHFNDMGVEMRPQSYSDRKPGFCEPTVTNKTDIGATCILPHLYLGSQKDVMDKTMMEAYGITYVLNVSKTCTQPGFIENDHFHRISVRDNYQEKMMPYMKEAITFIEKVRKMNKRVLVHCLAGVSRSATVAIAYVIYHNKMNFEDSYRFVKEKRPSISPNFNFLGQLMEFERTLKGEGHMTICKGDTVASDNNCTCASNLPVTYIENENTNNMNCSNNRTLNFFKQSDAPKFILPVTCSVANTMTNGATTTFTAKSKNLPQSSSFSKRRRGPPLAKIIITPKSETSTHIDTPAITNATYENETVSRLRIDVRVKVPSRAPDHSIRLGSDGTEMDDQDQDARIPPTFLRPQETKRTSTAPNTPVVEKKSLSLNLKKMRPTRHQRSASSGVAGINFNNSMDLKRRMWDDTCKSTSYIENMDTDDYTTRSKRSVSLNDSGNYFNLSAPSPRTPHKFVSCNSRSPKIMRKSFNLNLRPSYPYANSTLRQTNSENSISFDCSHSLKTPTDKPLKFTVDTDQTNGQSLTLNSISPLTLSSPTTEKNTDLFDRDEPMNFYSPATCPVTGSVPFLRTNSCITSPKVATSSITSNNNPRIAFKASVSCNHDTTAKKAFTLTAGCDLKLKWRNRRRPSWDSGYASSQASSSFTSPTSHIAFSPCEATITDDVVVGEEATEMSVDENRKFVAEPSSPAVCRNGVEIMSCS